MLDQHLSVPPSPWGRGPEWRRSVQPVQCEEGSEGALRSGKRTASLTQLSTNESPHGKGCASVMVFRRAPPCAEIFPSSRSYSQCWFGSSSIPQTFFFEPEKPCKQLVIRFLFKTATHVERQLGPCEDQQISLTPDSYPRGTRTRVMGPFDRSDVGGADDVCAVSLALRRSSYSSKGASKLKKKGSQNELSRRFSFSDLVRCSSAN